MDTPILILIALFIVVEVLGTFAAVWAYRDVQQQTEEGFGAAGSSRSQWLGKLRFAVLALQGIGGVGVAAWYVLRVRSRVRGA